MMYDEVAQNFRMCNVRSASPFCMLSRKQFTLLTRGNKAGMRGLPSSALFRETWTLGGFPASHSLRSKTLAHAPIGPLKQSPPPALYRRSFLVPVWITVCVLPLSGRLPDAKWHGHCLFNELIWNNQSTRRWQLGARGRN